MASITDTNEFRKSMVFVGKWEWSNKPDGGYTNDPNDPGGETKWGISKRAYPKVDIKNLSLEGAIKFYVRDYWVKGGCESVAFPFSTVVFDTSVNCGVGRATSWLKEYPTPVEFIERRKQHYIQIINKNDRLFKYWRGWMNRLNDLKKFVEINQPEEISFQPRVQGLD